MLVKVKRGTVSAKFELDQPVDLEIINEVWKRNVYSVSPVKGMRVLDIGAHKGIFSVFCGMQGCTVTAYEPCLANLERLKRNILLNGLQDRIEVKGLAVWSVCADLELHLNPGNHGGHNIHGDDRPCVSACDKLPLVLVRGIPFDVVIGDKDWDIVKVDCEGSEYEFLSDASEDVLKRIRYLTMEVHDWTGMDAYRRLIDRLSTVFSISLQNESATEPGRFFYLHGTRKP